MAVIIMKCFFALFNSIDPNPNTISFLFVYCSLV